MLPVESGYNCAHECICPAVQYEKNVTFVQNLRNVENKIRLLWENVR